MSLRSSLKAVPTDMGYLILAELEANSVSLKASERFPITHLLLAHVNFKTIIDTQKNLVAIWLVKVLLKRVSGFNSYLELPSRTLSSVYKPSNILQLDELKLKACKAETGKCGARKLNY